MSKNIILVLGVVAIITGGVYFVSKRTTLTTKTANSETKKTQVVAKKQESTATESASPTVQGASVHEVTVTAKDWAFEPSEITVKEGETVRLKITSVDVEHGIAIPEFGVDVKLHPNQTATAEFVASKKGTFPFFCNVRCGEGHRDMKGSLIVE